MFRAWVTSVRYALIEQARNRFALGLLVLFVPVWDGLFGALIPSTPVAFKLQSTGAFLQVNGHDLTVLTSGFNAITLIVAFMIFAAARRNAAFDRRLVLAGLPQPVAMAAKTTAIVVVSVLVSLYAALVLQVFWHSAGLVGFGAVWLGYLLDALIYGALGLLLGVLVSSELAGFFLIIMISLMDTTPAGAHREPAGQQGFPGGLPHLWADAGGRERRVRPWRAWRGDRASARLVRRLRAGGAGHLLAAHARMERTTCPFIAPDRGDAAGTTA